MYLCLFTMHMVWYTPVTIERARLLPSQSRMARHLRISPVVVILFSYNQAQVLRLTSHQERTTLGDLCIFWKVSVKQKVYRRLPCEVSLPLQERYWTQMHVPFRSPVFCGVEWYTLQELKLQGIKIRDGIVFSRYSLAKCFANDLRFLFPWMGGCIAQS